MTPVSRRSTVCRVMDNGETDLAILDEYLANITMPEATEVVKDIRAQMVAQRDLFKPFASDKW